MRDAAIDRLARIISDRATDNLDKRGGRQKPLFEIHVGIAEGWFSLVLLAVVVYSTIWSVQAAEWVDHLNILTLTTALGLVVGVLAAKQRRFPRLAIHCVVLALGLILAFWQTAGAFYDGSIPAFVHGINQWFTTAVSGGTGDDDSIFLFLIVALGFTLAYTSAWLVYRTRSPWMMIVANAVILLINLSNVDTRYILFLVIFLIASLLLLLRLNLYDSMRRWRRQGLRYADDIGWDIMQAGALISVGILIFSWILPGDYMDNTAAQIWNTSSNPWVQVENTWNRIISVNGGVTPANHGNFRDSLTLSGNPNLNHDVVMTVQSDDGSVYLESLSYENYDGRTWSNGSTDSINVKSNEAYLISTTKIKALQQKVTIVNPPGEQNPYLMGASDVIAVNTPAKVEISKASGATIAWESQRGNLTAGTRYTITSYVSVADIQTLRSVPMPANAPTYTTQDDQTDNSYIYNRAVVSASLQVPRNLDPQIAALAQKITAKADNMYDKVAALETYLRTNYNYSTDIQFPSGQEGTSWFLFRSGHKGYCNYFATAMTIMARSLGIPARIAIGYTNGTLDEKNHQRVITGVDAHAWTQVYFAGYGWINFEPSTSFATFTRLLHDTSSGLTGNGDTGANASSALPPDIKERQRDVADEGAGGTSTTIEQSQMQLRRGVGITLGSVILLLLFGCLLFMLWWRRLFRNYDLSAQVFGRLCVLANWAGIQLLPSQTPYEYIHGVATATPDDAVILERLGDIYVRDKWANPESVEHPRRSGEMRELFTLWRRLRPRLFFYVLRHPSFLLRLPQRVWTAVLRSRRQQRTPKMVEDDF